MNPLDDATWEDFAVWVTLAMLGAALAVVRLLIRLVFGR